MRLRRYRPRALVPLALVAVVAGVSTWGLTAANVVATSKADLENRSVLVAELAPTVCAGLGLTNLVTGSGTFRGGNSRDLLLGSAGSDNIDGRQQSDCVVGGGGNDQLDGGGGVDVCIGGPGTDTFTACETQIQA